MDFSDFDYRYKKTKVINLTVLEFNNKLDELEKLGYNIKLPGCTRDFLRDMRYQDGCSGDKVYLYSDDKVVENIYYQSIDPKTFKSKGHHYRCNLYLEKDTKEEDLKMCLGRKSIKEVKEYCSKYNEDIEFKGNMYFDRDDIKCRVFLPTNPKLPRRQWIKHCYGYDMNSCYPSFINNPLPYGDVIRENDIVHTGEIGFRFEQAFECSYIIMALENEYADMIFKSKYYKGLIEWANTQYQLKQEKKLDKALYNAMLGNMKHHNIFIRTAVLEYAYRYMESLYNPETTVLSTIDSIVSLVPRKDLNIGNGLGQFKEEHIDEPFIFESNGKKQWLTGEVVWKGKNKAEIVDQTFVRYGATYRFDYFKLRYVEIEYDPYLLRIWPEYKGEYNGKE